MLNSDWTVNFWGALKLFKIFISFIFLTRQLDLFCTLSSTSQQGSGIPACFVASGGQFSEFAPGCGLCSLCFLRLLKTQSLEWFYNNVKSRFKRFGSAKVLKTLYRKHLLEHSTLTELTGKSLSHSAWIAAVRWIFYGIRWVGEEAPHVDLIYSRSSEFTPPQQVIFHMFCLYMCICWIVFSSSHL